MRASFLCAALLLAVFLTPIGARRVSFLKLSRRLTRLRAPQICLAQKEKDISLFGRQIDIAIDCLPFDQRVRLRTQCRRRPKTMRSREACQKLAACPRVGPIKRNLKEAEMRRCPPITARFRRTEKRWTRRLNRRIRRAGLPKPVYPTIILEPRRKKATGAVVLLHGLGGSAFDSLVEAERIREEFPNTRIVLPQAPVQFVTAFSVSRTSWFDILGMTIDSPQATNEIVAAANGINSIAHVQEVVYGLSRERIGVFGFSQGGAVALTTYLRHKWGSAIGSSTFLPLMDRYPAELGSGSEDVELLMIHGTADTVVPFSIGVLSRDAIRGYGRKVRWAKLSGDHSLSFEQDIQFEEVFEQLRPVLS